MKISNIESARAGGIVPAGGSPVAPAAGAGAVGSGSGPSASVEISAQAQALSATRAEAASYVSAVNAVPDRVAKIAELKSSIAAGTYHVSSSDIASQMTRRAQADQLK